VFAGIVATLFGVALVVATYRAWTGRWRSWVGTRQDALVITLYPGAGAGFLLGGLGTLGVIPDDSPIGMVLLLILIVGLLFSFWTPKWWGPRWYRERDRDAGPNLRDPLTAVGYAAVAAAQPRDRQPEHPYPPVEMLGPVLTSWSGSWINGDESAPAAHGLTHAGAVEGKLHLHERGVSFISSRPEELIRGEATGQAFSADEVHGVRVVPRGAGPDGQPREASGARSLFPRLVLDTQLGPQLFEVTSAKRTAARIAETLHVELASS
jgi:hypothetical protein